MRLKLVYSLIILLLAGCQSATTTKTPVVATQPVVSQSLLIHLPGIGGELAIDRSLMRGLKEASLADQYQIYDWTGKNRGLVALGTINENLEQAKLVAEKITTFRRENPNGRIIITAHSGGTGVAIWMLEYLPDDVQVDQLVMLASALSPGCDLSKALRHVKGHAWSFYSKYDSEVLGRWTSVFGTVDRVQSEAAGYVGFKTDQPADPVQYAKLTQLPYDPSWWRYGNDGGHLGTMNATFAASIIAPLLNAK